MAYQETYTERPSNEIQTTLNLLFKEKERGLYTQDFAKVTEFPRADLSHAYLVKANFRGTAPVRAEVSLDPNKLMAELNRSSTRWLICKLICLSWFWICLSWYPYLCKSL
jgi:hypothetical protein